MKRESRIVFPRAEGLESWGFIYGSEFLFCKMKIVLEKDGGDSCAAMWMSLIPLSSTLKNESDSKFYVLHIIKYISI